MKNTYLDLLARYGIGSAHPGGFPLTRKLLSSVNICSNTKLLDLGCGTGQTLAYIARTFSCKAVGVDISSQMLSKAAQRLKAEGLAADLLRADVMNLPFPCDTFDIALSESVTVFTSINKALKEYARVIKREGILLAVEMTAVNPLTEGELKEIASVYGIPHVPVFTEWEKMLGDAGFADIRSYSIKMRPTVRFFSLKMLQDFQPHLSIMKRFRNRLEYRVYQCRRR